MLMSDDQLAGLLETLRKREKAYTNSAARAKTTHDMLMFSAFASTLDWVLREIRITIAPHTEPDPEIISDALGRERALADAAHQKEDNKPISSTTQKEEQSK
jgi:hypothetical protein